MESDHTPARAEGIEGLKIRKLRGDSGLYHVPNHDECIAINAALDRLREAEERERNVREQVQKWMAQSRETWIKVRKRGDDGDPLDAEHRAFAAVLALLDAPTPAEEQPVESRSVLRRKAIQTGTCPICGVTRHQAHGLAPAPAGTPESETAVLDALQRLFWSVGEMHDPMRLEPLLIVSREEYNAARAVMCTKADAPPVAGTPEET